MNWQFVPSEASQSLSWNVIILYSHIIDMLIYTYTCSCRIHTDAMNNDERRLLYKNMYLSFYCKGSKRVTQGFTVRGSWRPNRTAIYWPPLLWPSALCLSRSPGLRNRRPWGPSFLLSAGLLYHILSSNSSNLQLIRGPKSPFRWAFSTTSYQQLLWTPTQSGGPKGPFGLAWLSLPHLVSNSNCLTSCFDWVI